jgi:hypothetical protein
MDQLESSATVDSHSQDLHSQDLQLHDQTNLQDASANIIVDVVDASEGDNPEGLHASMISLNQHDETAAAVPEHDLLGVNESIGTAETAATPTNTNGLDIMSHASSFSLTPDLIKGLVHRYEDEQLIYMKSSSRFERRYQWIVNPNVILTGIGGFISFLAGSTLISSTVAVYLAIIVGAINTVSSIIQAIMNNLNLSTKASDFRKAADAYDRILVKLRFELINPDDKDFIDKIEAEVLKIKKDCKYFPPIDIINSVRKTMYTGKLKTLI